MEPYVVPFLWCTHPTLPSSSSPAPPPTTSAGVTAYDYPSALACRGSDVDFALVGDSVANVVYGYDRTSDLSPEEMAISVRAVSRGIRHKSLTQTPFAPPLLLADLVFGTYEASVSQGMRAAIQLIRAGADGVKLEGGDEALPLIRALSDYGIPVMAHLGLRPQRAPALTGFRVQGSDAVSALQVLKDALAAQEAGAASLLIEAVPQVVGAEISKLVQIPAIGIGAGVRTDGQILVHHDLVGDLTSPGAVQPPRVAGCTNLSSDSSMTGVPLAHELTPKPARFVRLFTDHFPNAAESTSATPAAEHDASATGYALRAKGRLTVGAARLHAVASYVAAVKNRSFPASEEVYKMRKEERTAFDQMAAELLQKQGNTSA